MDAIEEFSILTANYPAAYGKASGGVINATTRSGSNTVHGSVYEFLRNSALDTRNFFDMASAPPFRRNQFGIRRWAADQEPDVRLCRLRGHPPIDWSDECGDCAFANCAAADPFNRECQRGPGSGEIPGVLSAAERGAAGKWRYGSFYFRGPTSDQ